MQNSSVSPRSRLHVLTRIVRASSAPLLDECLQLRIILRQLHLQGDVHVASPMARARHTFSPKAQNFSGVGDPFRMVIVTGPEGVGTSILAPRTASAREMGRSSRISSPSRRKRG